jgi:hypothetical protein
MARRSGDQLLRVRAPARSAPYRRLPPRPHPCVGLATVLDVAQQEDVSPAIVNYGAQLGEKINDDHDTVR